MPTVALGDSSEESEVEPERITGINGKSYAAHKPVTIQATSSQQAEAATKLLDITGLTDSGDTLFSASQVIEDANSTLFANSRNRFDFNDEQ